MRETDESGCATAGKLGSPNAIERFINNDYTPANGARASLNDRITAFMNWRERGGFNIESVVRSEPFYVEAGVISPLTGEHWRLAVDIEATPPFRVERLLLGRAPLPVIKGCSSDRSIADQFVGFVDHLEAHGLFSGAVLIARHDVVLAEKAYGRANRDFDIPNQIDTRFNVASLCKSWTAVGICQMIEAGALSFETPLSDFLHYPDKESAGRIRIKHLLSHTSGLGDYFTHEFDHRARHHTRSLEDFLELAQHQLPEFAPGTAWRYSNIGMVLLGKIIELISGRSYFDHMQHAVLSRAGMTSSGFPQLDHVNKNTAVGYGKRWTTAGPVDCNSLFEGVVRGGPAGCGYATASDIFRFAQSFTRGDLVSHEMVKLMSSAKPELGAHDYGFGFSVHPERALYGHSGGLVGASANLDITCKPDGWVVVVLANDLGMRTPTLKARQLIGVTVQESVQGRSYLPRAGLSPR